MQCLIKIIILTIVLGFNYCLGQSCSEKWFQNNIEEFSSFSQLDELVKDKDYVFLGESSHGTDEFFKLKSEVIEYLVKEHHFEVVLFESPFAASLIYEYFPEKRIDSISHCEHILLPIFVNNHFIELIDRLDSLNVPVSGFDIQLGTEFQANNITDIVFDAFNQIDTVIGAEFLEIDKIHTQDYLVAFSKKNKWYKRPYHSRGTLDECHYWMKQYQRFYTFFQDNIDAIEEVLDGNQDKVQLIKIALLANISAINDYLVGDLNHRDALMYKNIKYLLNTKYAGKKVIFSAHNAHIAKNYQLVGDTIDYGNQTFGNMFNMEYGESSVTIGLYGIQGETNDNARQPVEMTAIQNDLTLEYHLQNHIDSVGIIDLNSYSLKKKKGMVYLSHWGIDPEKMFPKEQFDGIIFIKTLTPSVYEDH